MSTKIKVAIVLFVLQVVSVAGMFMRFLSAGEAIGQAIGTCIFTIIGIVLVCLDNKDRQKHDTDKVVGFQETSKNEEASNQNLIARIIFGILIFAVIAGILIYLFINL